MFAARGHEHCIYDTVYLRTTQGSQILVLETSLEPLYFAGLNALDQAIVKGGLFGCKQYWFRAHFD